MRVHLSAPMLLVVVAATSGWGVSHPAVIRLEHRRIVGPAVETHLATGFCLDPQCSVLATNAHVVKHTELQSIEGVRVQRVFSFSDSAGSMTADVSRDLALVQLASPLRLHTGAPISLRIPARGEQVMLHGYPAGLVAAELGLAQQQAIPMRFVRSLPRDVLVFEAEAGKLKRGVSGAMVVNASGQAVAMVSSIMGRQAYAISAARILDYVRSVLPSLAAALSPGEQFAGAQPRLYLPLEFLDPDSQLVQPGTQPRHEPELQPRRPDNEDVQNLRQTAESLAGSMENWVVHQSVQSSPGGNYEHDIRIHMGNVVFRDSGTGVESPQLSVPLPGLVPGGEWRDLARMIGNALKLRISPAGELTAGIPVRSYTFSAAAEDGACSIRVRTPFHGERLKTLGCTGSVWVDSAGRIVRIFEKLDTGAQTPLSHLSISLLYGELPGSGETVPAEMAMVAETKTGETYSSRVHYQGYRRAQGEAAESAGLLAARHP